MNSERWHRVQQLCKEALDLQRTEQQAFLAQACKQDEGLRRDVESLLAYQDEAETFIEAPAIEMAAQIVAQDEFGGTGWEAPDFNVAGKTISHYRILEKIGSGGMGVVYKAEDTKLGRFVALKFLSEYGSSVFDSPSSLADHAQALQRLEREARASSALDHPNICTVYEVDQYEGSAFIAMQFLNGETLKNTIGGKPLPVDRMVDLGVQLADALETAHSAGITHRDIKSANIFVTQRGEAKILDFGLAKLNTHESEAAAKGTNRSCACPAAPLSLESISSQGSLAFGTLAYMSPEQLLGKEVDARTDLFALGVVLYEMATGVLPFQGQTSQEVVQTILHTAPIPPQEINAALSQELNSIICKALQKDPGQRYQTAAQLRDDLKRLRPTPDSGPVLVQHSAVSKTWIGAALLLLLVVSAVGGYLLRHRHASRLTPQDTIVIADFDNNAGDPVFDDTLKQALKVQLEQSPFLNVLSEEKINQELLYMERPRGTRVTKDVARDLCIRTGSGALLAGSISRMGSHYLLSIEAEDCRSGDSIASEQVEAESRETVVRSLGEAATELRSRLGESLASVQQYDVPVEHATTKSLEALQAYSLGVKARLTEGDEAAVPFFRKATELDPDFAMAYAHLATSYFNLNQASKATIAFRKAHALRDKISERERLYIDSHYYFFGMGEAEKAIQVYEAWKRTYPQDIVPSIDLGTVYGVLGQHQKDLNEQLRALRLDPTDPLIYTNLAEAYTNLNEFDQVDDILAKARKLGLNDLLFVGNRYVLAFLHGDPAGMKQQFDLAMGHADLEGTLLELQADTEAYYGRLTKAREYTRRAADSARRNGDEETAVGHEIVGALRDVEFGNVQRAREEIAAAAVHNYSQPVQALAALALARAGRPEPALTAARNLGRQYPADTMLNNYWLPTIRAAVEIDHQNPAQAVDLLQKAAPYELGVPDTPIDEVAYPIYVRAQALLAARQAGDAKAEFQKLIDHSGLLGNYPLQALAYLGLARAYALDAGSSGHTDIANRNERLSQSQLQSLATSRHSYETFLSLWKDADRDIPVLKAAQSEYKMLCQNVACTIK